MTSKGRIEYRKVEDDDFYQGQWTFINEFEDLRNDLNAKIIVLEYRAEYLAAGCMKIEVEDGTGPERVGAGKSRTAKILKIETGERKQDFVRKKLIFALE